MFWRARQVSFHIGTGGPLHVWKFLQNVPLAGGTEAGETVHLGPLRSPWDGPV